MSRIVARNDLGIKHNVTLRVLDELTGGVVQEHVGHNAATNTMLTGIARYLTGESVLRQGEFTLGDYVPRYISLGTMGLISPLQDDKTYLPSSLGVGLATETEQVRLTRYMEQVPGYGADGYDLNENNGRPYAGLGPLFADVAVKSNCELISDRFPRQLISYREVVPETESELPQTVDVVFTAMISTGALESFKQGRVYIFITECGLWSNPKWVAGGQNGLLAGYRIVPPNQSNWDMSVESNRTLLKQQILRVGSNQVVQVIWKVQLGALSQLTLLH